MIKSPHVIGLKKHYKTREHYYLFTTLCNGGDLGQLKLSRVKGMLTEEECRVIMRKLVSGLRDLYEYDVVHRDLKLANVLLHFPNVGGAGEESSRNGDLLLKLMLGSQPDRQRIEFLSGIDLTKVPFEVKIADFGFSKYLNDSKNETSATICGTPLYMSP